MKDSVITVDQSGRALGTMDKMAAHYSGTLHRAFSVFIFNSQGQLLLQQRAFDKYHSGGLWTNTCCSHPYLGEKTADGAHRRLSQEMGMNSDLTELFQFTYRYEFDNGLTEHEYDHVFLGITDQLPQPDPSEAAGFRYIDIDTLRNEVALKPDEFTAWFKLCLERVIERYNDFAAGKQTLHNYVAEIKVADEHKQ